MAKIGDIIGQGAVSGRPTAKTAGHIWIDNTVDPPAQYRDNGTTWDGPFFFQDQAYARNAADARARQWMGV